MREVPLLGPRVLRCTEIDTDAGTFTVSTVSLDGAVQTPFEACVLGFAALFGGYQETGYETVVFCGTLQDEGGDLYARHYDTSDEARLGHQQVLDDIAGGRIVLRTLDKRRSTYSK